MSLLKKLAGQTAIYGLSSILARFFNYLLVPLHTAVFSTVQYGVITDMYAYVAFLIVLLTYGMETSFFRFSSKPELNEHKVFSTGATSLIITSLIFIVSAIAFRESIADALRYPDYEEFVVWFALIMGLDAMASLPMARLRALERPYAFASVNIVNVVVNIAFNLFFLYYCKQNYESGDPNALVSMVYRPEIGVGYVFISNLIASAVKFLMLSKELFNVSFYIDRALLKRMLIYALPLLLAGLAGIVNELLDRILLRQLLWSSHGEEYALSQLGIYGACYKVSIIITLFIQAFRYAAEPFFFQQSSAANAKQTYANVMNSFIAVCAVIFLGVMLFIDIFKYFIPKEAYWEGLRVVPILLFANIFLGMYYNQSVWYKLTDKTHWGAIIAVLGAVITVVLNILLIPKIGYMGSAWTTFAAYGSMVLISFVMGHKHYAIPYNFGKIFAYLITAVGLWALVDWAFPNQGVVDWVMRTVAVLGFGGMLVYIELISMKKQSEYES